jgi:hypothetical protein
MSTTRTPTDGNNHLSAPVKGEIKATSPQALILGYIRPLFSTRRRCVRDFSLRNPLRGVRIDQVRPDIVFCWRPRVANRSAPRD